MAGIVVGLLATASGTSFARGGPPVNCVLSVQAGVYGKSSATGISVDIQGSSPPFVLQRSQNGGPWTPVATVPVPAGVCTVTYNDTGLQPATTYSYRVVDSIEQISNVSSFVTAPQLIVRPTGDPSQGVQVSPTQWCSDTGSCQGWASIADSPFGGSLVTIGSPVKCGSGCAQYNVKAQFTYPGGHAAPIEIVPPSGYAVDDSFPYRPMACPPTESCNIGNAAWLTGQSLLGNNGQPLRVLCSTYPVSPDPEAFAENVGAYAAINVTAPSDPHHAWVYDIRTAGFTPTCGGTPAPTPISATYKWGQLWTAGVTTKVFRHGRLIKTGRLGSLKYGHHAWSFKHRHGRYTLDICGTRTRSHATNVHACIRKSYRF